ncbi:hypothetical protein AB0L40_09995 [Patulibacter sp. NPDC049589]|uniref:hypothetical protein n=1 Tax=Patulibacter sp. NPDC049589 TaxID=3154731 RepID=UPI003448C620
MVTGTRPAPVLAARAAVVASVVLAAFPAAAGASPSAPAAVTRASTTGAPVVVRLVPESRGRGKAQRIVTRIDAFSAGGVRRHVRTVRDGGLVPQPAVSPDRRRVAFARADGRIAIVTLRDGALRLLRPPGLPRPRPERGDVDRSRWAVAPGAGVSWSPDGRVVVAHALVQRDPDRWASTLGEVRSVACTVASGRCTTAGRGAPSDLLPLAGGRTLRLDGPSPSDDRDGGSSYQLDGVRQQRLVLARRRDPVRTAASVSASPTGSGRLRVLRAIRSDAKAGIVALGSRVSGPAGVLVRRNATRLGPPRDQEGIPSSGPAIDLRSRVLAPWLVSPTGHLSTLPLRLAVTPIGTLPDGRWLVPTSEVRASSRFGPPEPGLATLDRRGRVRALLVGGRPVTPVRLALDAGLPDPFAAGAGFLAAWPAGDDLLVALQDSGYGGTVFFLGDSALVRIPLDGRTPPRLVDHEGGASYDAR